MHGRVFDRTRARHRQSGGRKRRNARAAAALLASLTVTACGGGGDVPAEPTAATLGEQRILAPSAYRAQPPYADADVENGESLAQACLACHSLEQGDAVRAGPNLSGIFGRGAGTREGFDYSEAMTEAEFVWTPRALDAWLARPARFLPGTRMSFAGVPDAHDRNDLIAWLLEVTVDNKNKKSAQSE